MAGAEVRPSIFIPQGELFIASETERIQSNCGLFALIDVDGSIGGEKMRDMTFSAGAKLQHRAEGAVGYVVFDSHGQATPVKGKDTIAVAFQNGRLIPYIPDARITILHTRYPTSGDSDNKHNTQPLYHDGITLAHHGNLTNAQELKDKIRDFDWGEDFPNSDSWVALNAMARAKGETLEEKMVNAQKDFEGGWAFIATDGEAIVASRDPEGIRPLFLAVIGSWEEPQAFALSVEDSAFKISDINITDYREILPGETISIRGGKLSTVDLSPAEEQRSCVFEVVYMTNHDGRYGDVNVAEARMRAGERLWQEHPLFATVDNPITVMPVPDSGRDYEAGFFEAAQRSLGLAVKRVEGVKKNRMVGRNFIQPKGKRNPGERFIVIPELVRGRRVVLVDDTLVRGDTMGGENGHEGIVSRLRSAGAKEVHLRSGAPPIINPCYWGIAFPTHEELSAHNYPDIDERAKVLGLDSLGYLSLDGFFDAMGANEKTREKFCAHCFGGNSPRKIPTSLGVDSGTINLIEPAVARK